MNANHVQHPLLSNHRLRLQVLWVLLCISLWALGFALAELIIENLYFR